MSRAVNSSVPEAGYVSKRVFEQTGAIADADFSVVGAQDPSKIIAFDCSKAATATTSTIVAGGGRAALQLSSHAGTTAHVGLGTVTNNFANITVHGNLLFCQGKVTAGTTTGVAQKITLPAAYTIDTANLPAGNFVCGSLVSHHASTTTRGDIFFDGTITTDLFVSLAATSADLTKSLGNAVIATGDNVYFQFIVPVTGY